MSHSHEDEHLPDDLRHVADVLRSSLKRPMPATPKWLTDKVAKGELGRKTGKGMYDWKDGNAVKDHGAVAPSPDMTDRLILPMLDVCVTCLREGVVADEAIRRAQDVLWQTLRIVAEPGGAAAFAGLASGAYRPLTGERVAVVISGGNTTAVNFDR